MAILTLTINGDGNDVSGWTAEGGDYTRIQSDDGDTSRLYSPISNQVRQFSLTDSGLSGVTINSVTVYMKYRSLDPVSNTMQIGVRTGSSDYWGTTQDTVSSTSYILFSETWTTNPATSAAWTVADLDALQIGIKKINGVGGAVTYGYAEADYTAGGTPTGTQLKYWTGTEWKLLKYWTGSAWANATGVLKQWNGASWVGYTAPVGDGLLFENGNNIAYENGNTLERE